MFIRVERGSSVPLSRQIDEQVRAQILSGVLPPGEKLPSVRQLAGELAVNVNTIVRIYERLAAEKFIDMRHGDGTYVLPQAAGKRSQQQLAAQREQYGRDFDALIRSGLLLGYTSTELRRRLSAAVAEFRAEQK